MEFEGQEIAFFLTITAKHTPWKSLKCSQRNFILLLKSLNRQRSYLKDYLEVFGLCLETMGIYGPINGGLPVSHQGVGNEVECANAQKWGCFSKTFM